jgi:hypothetical protein
MLKKSILTIVLASVFVVTAGMAFYESNTDDTPVLDEEARATINVRIEQDNEGVWRVRSLNGRSQGTIRSTANDRINWQIRESDVEFTFYGNVDDYFEYDEGMFQNGNSQKISRGGVFSVRIKEDAPKGMLVYDVRIGDSDEFVVGNSPPVLIIR